jgi:hypothetical protein
MPQATPSPSPLYPMRLCFVSFLASQPPYLIGFFPHCRIGNPLRVLGSVTVDGRSLLTRTMWRYVARTRLLLARQYHAPEACLIASPPRPPF